MRIESSSYLPVPGARRPIDITPVQQVVLPKDGMRDEQLNRPERSFPDEGFEDALMQVSVPRQFHGRIAMLYEVQRLAQGPMQAVAGGQAFQAALAYGTSVTRRHLEHQPLMLPATRV
jgi:hypothetical protein